MEPKKIAQRFLEMYKENKSEEIIPLITNLSKDDKEVLKKIIDVQIQIKELGGGWPIVGKQITTIDEILTYSDLAINFAIQKDAKLTAGILNHNVASFCFPNMDEGVDNRLIDPGYQAAINDFKLRKEIGEKIPMMWAMWLVGVSEFIKGDILSSINTLEELKRIALEDPQSESLATWSDLMRIKFLIKSGEINKKDSKAEIERMESIFTKLNDDYGLSILNEIKKM